MTQKQMLLIFILAGVILAVILGVYFYRSNLGPSQGEFVSLLNEFVEKIAAGDFDGAKTSLAYSISLDRSNADARLLKRKIEAK